MNATTALLLTSFGAVTCSIILASVILIARSRLAFPSERFGHDIEMGVVEQAIPTANPSKHNSILKENSGDDHTVDLTESALRCTEFIQHEGTLDYSEESISFSESLKCRVNNTHDEEETRAFMGCLADSYARHYEKKTKKRRSELAKSATWPLVE